jgi:cation-transporting ATPase E
LDGLGPSELILNPLGLRVAVAVGQTSLAAFLVLTGLLLVVFVEPPTEWWTGGDVLSGDRRPILLAAALGLGFAAVLASPVLRSMFELAVLDWLDGVLVAGAAGLWLFGVRLVWRKRLLQRFFSMK